MNYTAEMEATVRIAERSSQVERVLSESDFEFMVESIADALDLQDGISNLSVGAQLRAGQLEITFALDAPSLAEANKKAIRVFDLAHRYAIRQLAERLGQRRSTPYLKASETRIAELVG